MKNATELLTAYLAQIQDPAAAAALFADDGVIELPWVKARAQGPVEIEKFLTGLLAKVPDLSFQNIRICIKTPDQAFGEYDVEALVPSTGKTYRQDLRPACRGNRKDQTLAGSARHQRCVTGIQQGLKDANGLHNINA
jgi:hypothetical protein